MFKLDKKMSKNDEFENPRGAKRSRLGTEGSAITSLGSGHSFNAENTLTRYNMSDGPLCKFIVFLYI